jgi:hypothetical protein
MAHNENLLTLSNLNYYEKTTFRFFFLFFLIQLLPIDAQFWQHLFSINWLKLEYRDIFYLSRYQPQFVPGGASFVNWVIIAAIAAIGTFIWSSRDRDLKHYNELDYWLRVVVRYRLAIGVLAYGFLKFFPMQAPPISISNLNTPYGDFTDWKIFSLSLGEVFGYQSFLGAVEIVAGLLLLNRKTAAIGAFLILPFTGNVFMSNLAYNGGEYVYSAYLIALSLYVFAPDGIRLFNLLSLERPTLPNRFRPVLIAWQKTGRLVLKTAFILFFVILYGFKTSEGYQEGQYHYPKTAGLPGKAGIYNVSEFRVNNQTLPYSKTDPIRWQDIVFEKWNTMSIKSNRPVMPVHAKTEEIYRNDADRIYELAGTQGRHYYSYKLDDINKKLVLTNRNKNHASEQLILNYNPLNDSTIILSGINEAQDSIYAVLNKLNKKYLIFEAQKSGRRKGLKL